MKAASLALFLPLLLATASQAQLPPPTRIAPKPAGSESLPPGAAGPLVITPETCRQLAAQQRGVPPAGYQPGVDVYGRPVAPADLPGSTAPMPPITTEIELGHVTAGRAASNGLIRGYVTVEPNGTVLLDGQPLPREQEYGLFDLCRTQHLLP